MLSPAGVPQKAEGDDMPKVKNKKGRGPPKWARAVAKKAWKKKWSPFGMMRKGGALIGKKMIKSYLSKRMGDLPKEEFQDMHAYMS